jgi:DNA-3-methyladenine glycosylase
MIKIKNLFDSVEPDDGERIWIEPIGLTLDLREWCRVDHLMSNLGPSMELFDWFAAHPSGYDYVEDQYERQLQGGEYEVALRGLASAARYRNYTLIHQGFNRDENSAAVLRAYLSALSTSA